MKTKKVYLTMDDVPSKDFKQKIDFLYEKNIQAICFCVGKDMAGHEEELIYAIKKGFILGNHSFSHGHFSDMSLEECTDDISKSDSLIEAVYKKANIKRPAKFFRFPFFDQGGNASGKEYEETHTTTNNDKKLALQAYLKELDYTHPDFKGINMKFFNDESLGKTIDVRCTFDQMEYWFGVNNAPFEMGKEENILHRIEEDAPYEGRALNCTDTVDVILIHDHEKTTDLFYKIVNRYAEKKFEFLRYF